MIRAMGRSMSAVLLLLPIAIMTVLLAGCNLVGSIEEPSSTVGNWESTDGASFITLNEDHSGSFTLCGPDVEDGGHRYNFDAKAWPATIPITWEEAPAPDPAPAGSIYLYQDWDLRQETGTGFATFDVSLYWRGGGLEMGADLVVRYVRTENEIPSC